MSETPDPPRGRLVAITIDDTSIARGNSNTAHEREVAIYDILDSNSFVVEGRDDGPYAFTRNPIYFGFLLMVIGFPLNYGHFWGFLTAPFYIVSMNQLVIEKEEAYLEKKFKEQYTAYRLRVRRWL